MFGALKVVNRGFVPGAICRNTKFSSERILSLNDLSHGEGAVKKRKRWGRGIGSGRGKNGGYGHQHSNSTPRAFEGGQTPLYKRLPKIGFSNINKQDIQILNLYKIQEFIDMGRLTPKPDSMLTMRDLLTSGLISQVRDGVKILAKGKQDFRSKIHLEVSAASSSAIKAIEAAGGTVTCVHFNQLALRSLIKPLKYELLPRRARPAPRVMGYFLDRTKSGYLSPEVQLRNLKLFGTVTSEQPMREEHTKYMDTRRVEMKVDREKKRSIMNGEVNTI